LKNPLNKRDIPIQAVSLTLYESIPGTTVERRGDEIIRNQWLYDVIKYCIEDLVLIDDNGHCEQRTRIGQGFARKKSFDRRKT